MIDDYERAYKLLKETYESRIALLDKYPLECQFCASAMDKLDKLDKLKKDNRELAIENWRLRKKMKELLR